MMSSMQRKALTFALLLASAAAVGAQLAPDTRVYNAQPAPQAGPPQTVPYSPPPAHVIGPRSYETAPMAQPRIASVVDRWRSLRQTDSLPFTSYASFLLSYRGWPGENSMRRSAEKAISPETSNPREVTSFFRAFPPLSSIGHARFASALLAEGNMAEARERPARPGSAASCRARTRTGCSACSAHRSPRRTMTRAWTCCSTIATRRARSARFP
jgi:hypothetical protein